MKTSSFILLLFSGFITLSSCTTRVMFQKVYVPEIIPPVKPAVMVFVNSFDYTDPDIIKPKHSDSYQAAVNLFFDGMQSVLKVEDSLKLFKCNALRKVGAGLFTTLMPADTIHNICALFGADMLLALDSIILEFAYNDDYFDSYWLLNFYYRRYYLTGKYFLTLYSSKGDMIDRSMVERTNYYSSRLAIIPEVGLNPALLNPGQRLKKVSLPAGKDYAMKFYPWPETITGNVYTGRDFRESNSYMKSGQWGKAVECLEALAGSGNTTLARKAKVNLEIAREGAGSMKH